MQALINYFSGFAYKQGRVCECTICFALLLQCLSLRSYFLNNLKYLSKPSERNNLLAFRSENVQTT